ncbi:MAG: hypothetical protein QM811_31440 [Pirellulales bacterium]
MVTAVAFRPDGRAIATGTGEGTIRLWNLADGKTIGPVLKQATRITTLEFSPDGSTLLSGTSGGSGAFWDLRGYERIGPEFAHEGMLLAAAYSHDGRYAVTSGGDLKARIWNTAPLASDPANVKRFCQTVTGLERGADKAIRALPAQEWRERVEVLNMSPAKR